MAGWDRAPNFQSSLTNLTLSRLNPDTRPTAPQLLYALQRCPHLETVIISTALSQTLGVAPEVIHPALMVELPGLQSFQIRDQSPTIVAFMLSHLSVPLSCSMFFHCHGMKDLSLILPPDLSRIRSFALDYGRGPPATQLLQIFRSHLTILNEPSRRLSAIEFAFVPDHLPAVLSNLGRVRRVLSQITMLEIAVTHPSIPLVQIPVHAWSTLLSCLPMLSSLRIGGPWSRSVLSALSRPEATSRNGAPPSISTGSIPCPHLHSMQILDRLFQNPAETSQLVNSLGRCMAARFMHFRAPLQALGIEVLGETTRAAFTEKAAELRRLVTSFKVHEGPLPSLSAEPGIWNDAHLRYSFQPPPTRFS